jgi:hypothetical protein
MTHPSLNQHDSRTKIGEFEPEFVEKMQFYL